MDTIALWVGRVVMAACGIGLAGFVLVWSLWYSVEKLLGCRKNIDTLMKWHDAYEREESRGRRAMLTQEKESGR